MSLWWVHFHFSQIIILPDSISKEVCQPKASTAKKEWKNHQEKKIYEIKINERKAFRNGKKSISGNHYTKHVDKQQWIRLSICLFIFIIVICIDVEKGRESETAYLAEPIRRFEYSEQSSLLRITYTQKETGKRHTLVFLFTPFPFFFFFVAFFG